MGVRQSKDRVYVTCQGATVVSGEIAADGGFVGQAVKQKTEDVRTVLPANLNVIQIGESYLLVTEGEIEVPNTGISGAALGDLIYIDTSTNVLYTATGAGRALAGKVSCLAGQRACPSNKLRIHLNKQ